MKLIIIAIALATISLIGIQSALAQQLTSIPPGMYQCLAFS